MLHYPELGGVALNQSLIAENIFARSTIAIIWIDGKNRFTVNNVQVKSARILRQDRTQKSNRKESDSRMYLPSSSLVILIVAVRFILPDLEFGGVEEVELADVVMMVK